MSLTAPLGLLQEAMLYITGQLWPRSLIRNKDVIVTNICFMMKSACQSDKFLFACATELES